MAVRWQLVDLSTHLVPKYAEEFDGFGLVIFCGGEKDDAILIEVGIAMFEPGLFGPGHRVRADEIDALIKEEVANFADD